jgi:hypothetical protein
MMNKVVKVLAIIGAVILIVALIISVSAVFAQDAGEESQGEIQHLRRLPFFGPLLDRVGRGFGPTTQDRVLEGVTPWDELLAEALDITLDDLQAARAEARANWLAEMVEAGYLEQEQVDLMLALQALKDALDRQEIVASALGLEVSELAEARENGARLAEVLEQQGLSPQEFREAIRSAVEEAILAAVPEYISQEQAELILERLSGIGCRCRRHPFGGIPGRWFHGALFRGPGLRGGFSGLVPGSG